MLLKILSNKDLIILNFIELITLKVLFKINRLNVFTIKEVKLVFINLVLSSLFYKA